MLRSEQDAELQPPPLLSRRSARGFGRASGGAARRYAADRERTDPNPRAMARRHVVRAVADRPAVDGVREDGAWIYPGTGPDSDICAIAWWFGGTLHDLHVVRLPQLQVTAPAEGTTATPVNADEARAAFLQEHLLQVAWAGELEGWLVLPVKWHIVADDETAARWIPLLSNYTNPFK